MRIELGEHLGRQDSLRVVVITGAPGVGKTETGRRVVRRYAVPAGLIDSDPVVYPWQADERLHTLIAASLRGCLSAYRAWGARVMVITGVLLPDRTLPYLADLLADPALHWVFYGLRASPEALANRVQHDARCLDTAVRLEEGLLDAEVLAIPEVRVVDSTYLGLDDVVERIIEFEATDLGTGCVTRGQQGLERDVE